MFAARQADATIEVSERDIARSLSLFALRGASGAFKMERDGKGKDRQAEAVSVSNPI
jgi:hypothetical protein